MKFFPQEQIGIEEQGGTTDTIRRLFVNNQNGVYRTGQTRLVCGTFELKIYRTDCIPPMFPIIHMIIHDLVVLYSNILINEQTRIRLEQGGK